MLWTEDQELELQRLFEEFQDSDGKRRQGFRASEMRAELSVSCPCLLFPRKPYSIPFFPLLYLWCHL